MSDPIEQFNAVPGGYKPCKFCGNADSIEEVGQDLWWQAVCPKCHAAGPVGECPRFAQDLWNKVHEPTLPVIPEDQFVITGADMNHALGSKELKSCPFCGKWAISAGTKNPTTGNTVYTVHCTNQLKCSASTICCSKDPADARAEAIKQWNRRVESK